jgi:hypothetical protein
VAPVTVHHRVDFAGSMIDGRTVSEVDAKCASAKEVRDLWTYVQDRLSRLMKDPTLLPEMRPQHFAVSALSNGDETSAPFVEEISLEPPPLVEPWDGVERRSSVDRREMAQATPRFGERRLHPFGRRAGDAPHFGKAGH